jgi:glucan phosphoethanolaminetransferase (alkaline phosphatase superfamily)
MNPFLFALLFSFLLSLGDYLVKGHIEPLYLALYFLLALQPIRIFLVLLLFLTLLNQLFFSYFGREWLSSDIYNFFTHTGETFETFFAFLPLFWKPALLFIFGILLLRYKPKPSKTKTTYANTIFLIVVSLFTLPVFRPFLPTLNRTQLHATASETIMPLHPKRHPQTDIILVVGESMKYDNYVAQKLNELSLFHKKIIAGATNTDVSLPLLINAETNPLHLKKESQTNLFALAKKNGFFTAFVSTQSQKALRYIKPYLQTDAIDFYRSYDKKDIVPDYDMLLLETLKNLPHQKPWFIVLEQIGSHAPYIYFPGKKSDSPQENYRKSIDYSVLFYQKLIAYLKQNGHPFMLFYTSDHGEFTGEEGRWGHNSFAETIYEVPFFVTANTPLPPNTTRIKTHHALSRMLIYLLGYGELPDLNETKTIVNGTMLTREDGCIEVSLD